MSDDVKEPGAARRDMVPPCLQEGGSWLPVIREELRKELNSQAYVQARQQPPWFLRWLLRPWLHL